MKQVENKQQNILAKDPIINKFFLNNQSRAMS